MIKFKGTIDLHMHTTVSDGTDTPEIISQKVKAAGISLFSVTDHDALKAATIIPAILNSYDPQFIPGIEFSSRDEFGKYHILGYNFDPTNKELNDFVNHGHNMRMDKVKGRLEFLETEFGFKFPDNEIEHLLSMDNPGKPHIGNLMVKYGYAPTKELAITEFINKKKFPNQYVTPKEAIRAILAGGGIPILAHPFYGSGDELILGDDMDFRLRHLIKLGIRGVEAFYSGFTDNLRNNMINFAEKYDLLITAGSDYHGTNKLVPLGDTGLNHGLSFPRGLEDFLKEINYEHN
ncbi:MAG: PHP domain-containing protein [Lachnospiraceae bacterium]|nr:PHP domain-containing protein [Lachnospiraceae bacterium]